MKSLRSVTLLLAFLVLAFCTGARGQGSVNVGNTTTTTFRTNLVASGGTSGPVLSALGPWYYELLTAPSTVTSVDASLQQLLAPPWSDTGVQMTNTGIAGRENGGVGGIASPNFWPAGQTNSFIIVGWSHSLGSSWAAVAQKLQGATFSTLASAWSGGGFNTDLQDYLGATTVGFRQAGGVVGGNSIPTPLLFGSVPDAQGNPITTPTTLWIVVPEPSASALVAVALALVARIKRRTPKTQN